MIKNKRIEYIDFIKGICIFIVVWGHTIQNMGDGDEFINNSFTFALGNKFKRIINGC